MSSAVTRDPGRPSATISVDRPEPAPMSSTRPRPSGRNAAVGRTSGSLASISRWTMSDPASAQEAAARKTTSSQRGHLSLHASSASAAKAAHRMLWLSVKAQV